MYLCLILGTQANSLTGVRVFVSWCVLDAETIRRSEETAPVSDDGPGVGLRDIT